MYRKKRTLTIPVEYTEVVVPFDKIPDDADVRFIYHGEVVEGIEQDDGMLIGYSENAEEKVTIEYGLVEKEEKEDVVTPIVQAVKEIPQPHDTDLAPIVDGLNNLLLAIEQTKQTPAPTDTKILQALERIRTALTELKKEEQVDYSAMFGYLEDKIDKIPTLDTTDIVALLKKIAERPEQVPLAPVDFPRNSEGMLKVEVDRTGFGGLTGKESKDLATIASNQEAILNAQDITAKYSISDIDETGATKYYGFLSKDGAWYIMSLTGTEARYIAGTSDYDFSTRTSLTYTTFNEAF